MSRWLMARSGKWPLPISASYITTRPIRPSLLLSSRCYASQDAKPGRKLSWSEWVNLHPTSAEELKTVYDVCVQSNIFGSVAERPIIVTETSHLSVTKRIRRTKIGDVLETFKQTPGLQPADWEAKGIAFLHAVEVTGRLHQNHAFTKPKFVKDIIRSWPDILRNAEKAKGAGQAAQTVAAVEPAFTKGTIAKPAAARKEAPGRYEQQQQEDTDMGSKVRQLLRARKKAEQDSDAAEGIRSKRRPLRIAATSNGVPLAFENMEKLRRLERGGREIIVDKQVKTRTKGASVNRELWQQKKNE